LAPPRGGNVLGRRRHHPHRGSGPPHHGRLRHQSLPLPCLGGTAGSRLVGKMAGLGGEVAEERGDVEVVWREMK
jgi:hypothetical protein